jgi:nitrite reductase (cytochrome c-552)
MLSDQRETRRVAEFRQPGACLHCHSAVMPAYRAAGGGDVMKGFGIVNALPLESATAMVEHPITCGDCHDPATMNLRVTRPAFFEGIARLAASAETLPWFPSIDRWRRGDRRTPYDPNTLASRQEMRSFVCAQCHVEYHFHGPEKRLTYPWHEGLGVEDIERYYDGLGFKDWTHATTGAPTLKAQHPEFEMWNRGIHARSGVACADCHMPYVREGAVKVSDHHVRSPLLNVARACQTCHHFPEGEMLARAEAIQDRTRALMDRAEVAVMDLIEAVRAARGRGADTDALRPALEAHRRAQWRLDYVAAENSMGFHAPQEAARILAEAIDHARRGVAEAERVRR